jgi:nicotinamidase-related amidase
VRDLPPGETGLLVVELQNDLVHPSLAERGGLPGALARAVRDREVLPRLRGLLDTARERGAPVLYATKERAAGAPLPDHAPIYDRAGAGDPILVTGTWGAGIVDEVAPQPGDIVLPRLTSIDPSHGSDLWPAAERLGLRAFVVAGVSTTLAVEGVVRGAANRGYRVTVVEDCCASVPEAWHRFSAENVLPLLADVVSAAEVTERLERWPRP